MTGDLATGEGIQAAVEGTEIIVHLAGSTKGDEDKARHLVRAASRAGARHLVYISVVGADRIPVVSGIDRAMFGYFASKLAAEQAVADSGLPWTTLRATQFHDLILLTVRQLARLPVIPVPAGFRFQPVDAGEVADRLVELALGPPAGLVPDMAGPRVYEMAELVRGYLRATWQAPADPAGLAARQGRPRVPGWREPGPGPGGGPPDLGGLPGRAGELAERQQIRPDIAAGVNRPASTASPDSNGTGLPDPGDRPMKGCRASWCATAACRTGMGPAGGRRGLVGRRDVT